MCTTKVLFHLYGYLLLPNYDFFFFKKKKKKKKKKKVWFFSMENAIKMFSNS